MRLSLRAVRLSRTFVTVDIYSGFRSVVFHEGSGKVETYAVS
jgi:hypothetical protein